MSRKHLPGKSAHRKTPPPITEFAQQGLSACSEPLPDPNRPPTTILDGVCSPLQLDPASRAWAQHQVATGDTRLLLAVLLKDPRNHADVLMDLALACFIQGDLPRGRDMTAKALPLWAQVRDHRMLLECLMRAGRYHQHYGDLASTIRYYEQVIERASDAPQFGPPARFNVLLSLAQLCGHVKDHARAVRHCQAALKIIRGERQPHLVVMSLVTLCHLQMQAGQLQEALAAGQEALKMLRTAGDGEAAVNVRYFLSAIYRDLGEHRECAGQEEALLRAARARRAPRPYMVERLVHLGMAWLRAGEESKAAECLGEALPLVDAERNVPLAAHVRVNLATLLLRRGEHRAALRLYEEALAGTAEGARPMVLIGVGDAHVKLGHKQRATAAYAEAVAGLRLLGQQAQVMEVLVRLGDARLEAEPREAIACFREWLQGRLAQGLAPRLEELRVHQRAGVLCLSLEQAGEAAQHFRSMLSIARDLDDAEEQGLALELLGQAHLQLGDGAMAAALLEQAAQILGAAGLAQRAAAVRSTLTALEQGGSAVWVN